MKSIVNLILVNCPRTHRALSAEGGNALFDLMCHEVARVPASATNVRKRFVAALPYNGGFIGMHDEVVQNVANEERPYRHRLSLGRSVALDLGEILSSADERLTGTALHSFRALLVPTFPLWSTCQLTREGMLYIVSNASNLAGMVAAGDLILSDALYQFAVLRDTMGLPCNSNSVEDDMVVVKPAKPRSI